MPRVLADQKAHAPEARIECTQLPARAEEARIVKKPIGGQVNFVMQVKQFAIRQVRGGDGKVVSLVFADESQRDVNRAAGVQQLGESGVGCLCVEGDLWY